VKYRLEHDSIGDLEVPLNALYGIQTRRAVLNFPISELRQHTSFIFSIVQIKKAAARFHQKVGWLDSKKATQIIRAADEILLKYQWLDHFVVDVYQAGAGTSCNMNVNEVLANRAIELLGGKRGQYHLIHPNDHVNMGQSTNDVIPTAMRLSTLALLSQFIPTLQKLSQTFLKKSNEFKRVYKSGRTHLQDAAPVTLGQEFAAYAESLKNHVQRIIQAQKDLFNLGIGGTAVGTGLNTHPDYRQHMVKFLSEQTKFAFHVHPNTFEAMQSMAPFVQVSNAIRNLTLDLIRIGNDLRLMTSGPTTGFEEIILPALQPGSSIMPGKVNPSMVECLNMVGFQVLGHDATIAMASQAGQLELNVMMPVLSYNLLQEISILTNLIKVFDEKCVQGIQANVHRCLEYAEKSVSIATALNPVIGYEKAAEVVKSALKERKTIKQIVLERQILKEEQYQQVVQLQKLVDPLNKSFKTLKKK
jgi:aspartate ammonia-lyase